MGLPSSVFILVSLFVGLSSGQIDSLANFDDFMTYAEIAAYLDALADGFDWVETANAGLTFEGKDTVALRILKAGEGAPNVLIEGGEPS